LAIIQKNSAMARVIGRTNQLSWEELVSIFHDQKKVKAAVLFGSRAGNSAGPQSDYDIAVWLDCPIGGLEDPFYTLYADLPVLMNIQECDLDLVDLRKADAFLKRSIKDSYRIIKGNEDEISRILAEDY
jgi:predicted nucleotidyltransferase